MFKIFYLNHPPVAKQQLSADSAVCVVISILNIDNSVSVYLAHTAIESKIN